MLDNDKQINAFGILSAQGMTTPVPVITYREAIELADRLKQAITALLLPDADYAAASMYTNKLPGYANTLAKASSESDRFIKVIQGYTTPSDLLQMKIGWDCYTKGNRLNPAPVFALVEGLCDTEVSKGMVDKLEAISLTALTAAMRPINAKVEAAMPPPGGDTGAGGGSTPPPLPPSFTAAEIKALKDATDALDTKFPLISSTSTLTSQYTDRINTSTGAASKALSDAVAIALTVGLVTDPVMSAAIEAIMPPGVITVLKED